MNIEQTSSLLVILDDDKSFKVRYEDLIESGECARSASTPQSSS